MTLDIQLEELESAQLVRRTLEEELAYLFKHALTQEAAYESLLLKSRREIHRFVGEAYERHYPERLDELAAVLAHHFAESGNDEKLVEYAIRAGDYAQRLNAHPEAEAHYTLALLALARLPATDANRRAQVDVIVKRTEVSFLAASPEQNRASLEQAEALVKDLLFKGETSPGDRLRLARIQMWIGRMHFYMMRRHTARESMMQVLPIAQELGDRELAALASSSLARILLWQGEFGPAMSLLQEAAPLLESSQNWTEWILAESLLGLALAARGDYRAGVVAAESALARAQELHHLSGISTVFALLAAIHMMAGDTGQMLAASHSAVEAGMATKSILPTYSAFGTQAWAESRSGQHDAARVSMAQADAITQKLGGHYLIDDWFAAIRAEMALNAGEFQEALTRAEQAVTLARSVDGRFAEGIAQKTWGIALAALDSPRWDDAEAHLAASLELLRSCEAVLEAARAHVAWGQVLRKRGSIEAARGHFEQAAAQFRASGMERELQQKENSY